MAVPTPPELIALSIPRFSTFRHSLIPLPASIKQELRDRSPKSVISDMRFISPGSSSSSSAERRTISDLPNSIKSQPGRGRSLRLSDEADPDPISQELGKPGNSLPLVSMVKDTSHVSALETPNSAVLIANKRGGDKSKTRVPSATTVKATVASSLPTALIVLAERAGSGPRTVQSPSPRSSAGLRDDLNSRATDRAIWTRPTRDVNANGRRSYRTPTVASKSAAEVEDRAYQLSESSDSSRSSIRPNKTKSETEPQPRNLKIRPTFSGELTWNGKMLERVDSTKRRSVGQGVAVNRPATSSPGCQEKPRAGSRNHTHNGSSISPTVKKREESVSPATSTDVPVRLRTQRPFLSGPIVGSMIPKPPPSKWDDAEKWIVSPGRSENPAKPHYRSLQSLLTSRRHSITIGQSLRSKHGTGSPDSAGPTRDSAYPQFKNAFPNAGEVEGGTKHTSSQKKQSKALFGDFTRRFDPSPKNTRALDRKQEHVRRESGGQGGESSSRDTQIKAPVNDKLTELNLEMPSSAHKPVSSEEPSIVKLEISHSASKVSLDGKSTTHSHSASMREPSAASVAAESIINRNPASCKGISTQIIPGEGHKNPISSSSVSGFTISPTRHNTPAGRRASSLGTIPGLIDVLELQTGHIAKLELRKLTGDDQPTLDRGHAWTTREEEELETAASLREDPEVLERDQLTAKAATWEDAEQEKCLARYKEAKIKVWEELQRAQAEAEMKSTEVQPTS